MLLRSLDDIALEVAEDWLIEIYEEDKEIEPIYLYMRKKNAESLYATNDLTIQFHVTEYDNEMVKLILREPSIAD
tara:strand:+ start:201 stop:425 length:225 start_codon:yes stop_codon:yes gene_type:complete